ncbi:transcriptional regulator [Actinomyces oris]|uniref:transcriptional regulator n=1 Tax=Actinomyces oris TaxID=544580 RepID=UPI0022FD8C64|nr:transcriptional regulator [Actinomyces oris]WCA43098.1 transcriptional regulator [Actinomyces oris]
MTTSFSAADLAHLVTAVPGVRAIEPGIGSTLRAIGSRMRQQDPQQARFGVIVEEGSRRAVIEIGIDGSRPVKDIVRDVQEAIIGSLSQASESDDASEAQEGSGSSDVGEENMPQVTVRVQSLL